jgi:hypothetical protein
MLIIANICRAILLLILVLPNISSFKRPNIIRCPSYPNINNIYNYTYNFQNVDNVLYDNYKYIINDKKKRNVYLRLRENMVNRNIYM